LSTAVPQIILAVEGKADFASQTNPFGPSKPKKKADEKTIQDQRNLFQRMKLDAAQRQKEKRGQSHGK
jgi:hypothetical protein